MKTIVAPGCPLVQSRRAPTGRPKNNETGNESMRTARSSPNEQDSALQEMGRGPSAPSACLRPPGAQFAIFECAGYSYISRSRSRLTATASCRTSVIWMLSVSIAHYTPRDATLAVATLSLHQPQGEKQARYNDKTKTENEPTCVRNRPRKAPIFPLGGGAVPGPRWCVVGAWSCVENLQWSVVRRSFPLSASVCEYSSIYFERRDREVSSHLGA